MQAELVAFVPSTDLERAEHFYVGVLGLDAVEVSPYALVVQSGPTLVRVTKVEHLDPQPFTVLGWTVSDVASSLADLVERGVTAERFDGMGQDGYGVWTTPSERVTRSPTSDATSAGKSASYSMRPTLTTSSPKIAPAIGVPKTDPKPPAIPAARRRRRVSFVAFQR